MAATCRRPCRFISGTLDFPHGRASGGRTVRPRSSKVCHSSDSIGVSGFRCLSNGSCGAEVPRASSVSSVPMSSTSNDRRQSMERDCGSNTFDPNGKAMQNVSRLLINRCARTSGGWCSLMTEASRRCLYRSSTKSSPDLKAIPLHSTRAGIGSRTLFPGTHRSTQT